jgi:hypothetical protein
MKNDGALITLGVVAALAAASQARRGNRNINRRDALECIDLSLNEALWFIQDKLGIQDGGPASEYWMGYNEHEYTDLMFEYIVEANKAHERNMETHDEALLSALFQQQGSAAWTWTREAPDDEKIITNSLSVALNKLHQCMNEEGVIHMDERYAEVYWNPQRKREYRQIMQAYINYERSIDHPATMKSISGTTLYGRWEE